MRLMGRWLEANGAMFELASLALTGTLLIAKCKRS